MPRFADNMRKPLLLTAAYLLCWLVVVTECALVRILPPMVYGLILTISFPTGLAWLYWVLRPTRKPTVLVNLVASGLFLLWWTSAVYLLDIFNWGESRGLVARWGTAALFLIGLAWVVWFVERRSEFYQLRRTEQQRWPKALETRSYGGEHSRVWNPLDPSAWYFGNPKNKRLNQSIATLVSYSGSFLMVFLLLTSTRGCQEIYELPSGGGEPKTLALPTKIQKIIRKKYIVNPYSSILFNERKIDDVKLQFNEVTKHEYQLGQGQGAGAGFGGGTPRGKVRFIRLEYVGGDWDQDFGVRGDMEMLFEYGRRTDHKIHDKTESRRIVELGNFPIGKSPPLVYMTGQKNISLSKSEYKILREYLIEKHGMIFCDNGGSRHFHNQFLSIMSHILPDIRPVPVPLDDQIHRVPFIIPFLPYVAPHGGKEALGWYKDGRWICYYHPGDIGDAWAAGHAGVAPEIWEACYQLGTNVIFYAHAEYSRWLDARKKGS
ncbi:MAG TPA: DUF4159 domain-containing protein [Planctomycetaceae bacterium]|nr:DUF4159 domain-containing protein [Planctomycetaceae bacterium]